MLRTVTFGVGLLLLAACGGGGDDDDDDDSGPGGEAPRLWDRQRVQEGGGSPGLAIAGDGTVDIVTVGTVGGESGVVWQELGGDAELVEVTDQVSSHPRVGRDASGAVHVVWATSLGGEVRYAVRTGASWTVETIATDRFRPDLAVAADGTPHVAFVDEETGNAMAYHAVRGAGGWEVATVNPTDWFSESEVGIALTDGDLPVVAGIHSDRTGVWLAADDGAGGWTVEDLAPERYVTGRLALAVGAAGIAIAFKDDSQTAVAWRAADGDAWSIEDASHHDSDGDPIGVAVGPGGPIVVSDVDVQYPNGLALLERTSAGWSGQQLASYSCGGGVSLAIDPAGQPAMALTCEGDVYFMTVVGTYPEDWSEQCEAAAAEMCQGACSCGVEGEDCCWGLGGNSTCTSSFGCPTNGVAALCGDPTVSPADLQQCRDELPSLTCSAGGPLELSGACEPLYLPFR